MTPGSTGPESSKKEECHQGSAGARFYSWKVLLLRVRRMYLWTVVLLFCIHVTITTNTNIDKHIMVLLLGNCTWNHPLTIYNQGFSLSSPTNLRKWQKKNGLRFCFNLKLKAKKVLKMFYSLSPYICSSLVV